MKVLLLCLICLPVSAFAEEQICSVDLKEDYPEEMLIGEEKYTQAEAMNAIKFLETTLPRSIQNGKDLEEVKWGEIVFLPNFTQVLKGYILKQGYKLARVEYELAVSTGSKDAEERHSSMKTARKALCDYMETIPTFVD